MSFAVTVPDGHDAYLHELNRVLIGGLVASLVVHAALMELLPSPFHHYHKPPPELQVELVEAPPPPEPPKPEELKPAVEPPAPLSAAPATPAKPKAEPAKSRKAAHEPKARRERPPVPAPPPPVAEHLLTHAEPAKAVTTVPAASERADGQEKPAAPKSNVEGEGNPETPPTFRAGYLRNPEPPYPAASRRLGEQGMVQLRVLVGADGRAANVEVHRSSGFPRLDQTAAAAVREWRFVPAKRGDKPIEASVIVPIVFKLQPE